MLFHSFSHLPAVKARSSALVLGAILLSGSFLGIWFSGFAGELFASTIHTVADARVSMVGLLSCVMLPFFLSAFVVYIRQPVLLLAVAFCKGFLFSYLCFGLVLAWGDAGWLVAGLLMFGSACSLPVLCWYWLRHLDGRRFDALSFGLALGALLIVGILDDCFIVPFLASIISF